MDDPSLALAERLQTTRAYARDCEALPVDEVVAGCLSSLDTHGFCVIDRGKQGSCGGSGQLLSRICGQCGLAVCLTKRSDGAGQHSDLSAPSFLPQ